MLVKRCYHGTVKQQFLISCEVVILTVRNKRLLVLGTAGALLIALLSGCSAFNKPEASPAASPSPDISASPSPTPTPTSSLTKAAIQAKLDALGDSVYDVSWSPNSEMVAFIKDENGSGNVYVWKLSSSEAALVSSADPTMDGFSWAPDSRHFLINVGHMGPGTITSTLIDSASLEVLDTDITTGSVSPPVWSPDGKHFALSVDDETNNTIKLLIYTVASNTSVSVLSSQNSYGPYVVEQWNFETITYTEVTSTGDRIESTLAVGD